MKKSDLSDKPRIKTYSKCKVQVILIKKTTIFKALFSVMTSEQSGKLPQSFFILYDYCVPDRSSVLTFKKLIWIYWSKHHNLVFLQFGTKVVKVPLISPNRKQDFLLSSLSSDWCHCSTLQLKPHSTILQKHTSSQSPFESKFSLAQCNLLSGFKLQAHF